MLRVHLSKLVQDFLQSGQAPLAASATPIAATASPTQAPVESTEDEGFLDLIETNATESQRVTEVIQHLTEALVQLGNRTEEATRDMRSVGGDDKAKFAAYKCISNRQADNMADFVTQMRSELPILDDSLSKALDAYGRAITLLPDFGTSPENYSQLRDAIGTVAALRAEMVSSKKNIEQFRSIIAGLPRVTIQFNRAKRNLLSLLDTFLAIYERGLNLLGEIEATSNSILRSWKPEATPPTEQPGQDTA